MADPIKIDGSITTDVGQGLKVADDALVLTTQIDREMNTPAEIQAQLEQHATAAHNKLVNAIRNKDLDTIRKMAQPLVMALLLSVAGFLMTACAHTPPVGDDSDKPAYYDSSTPAQYYAWNSGILDEIIIGNKWYFVITQNRAKSEPTATPYTDKFGNKVYLLDVGIPVNEYDQKYATKQHKIESAK